MELVVSQIREVKLNDNGSIIYEYGGNSDISSKLKDELLKQLTDAAGIDFATAAIRFLARDNQFLRFGRLKLVFEVSPGKMIDGKVGSPTVEMTAVGEDGAELSSCKAPRDGFSRLFGISFE